MMRLNWKTTARLMLVALLMFLTVNSVSLAAEATTADEKIAVVDDVVITMAELDYVTKRYQKNVQERGGNIPEKSLDGVRSNLLEFLIGQRLLFLESGKSGIAIDDRMLEKQYLEIKKSYPGEEEFHKMLQEHNLSEAAWKKDLLITITVKQYIDEKIIKQLTITEEDAKSFYDKSIEKFKQPEQVQASHILINVDATADEKKKEEALSTIKDIQKRLKQGGDFAELAKEKSQCPSASRGGDLGYFARGKMVPSFEEAAFSLTPGKISDIVETKFGYHLIKVVDKKPADTIAFDDVKESIQQYLRADSAKKEIAAHVEKLMKKAKIERFPASS